MSKQKWSTWLTACALLAFASSSVVGGSAHAQNAGPMAKSAVQADSGYTIYAITTAGNNLLRLNSASPSTIISTTAIEGVQAGETVLGIDFRPATGQLFALGSTGALYTLNTTTGAATPASIITTTALNGTEFGVDFNPTVDRLRIVSNAGQNLRVNVDTGATTIDGTLAYTATDTNTGAVPNIVGAAYTNNFTGATSTTLYVIDSNLDIVATQNPPNNGVLNTIGMLDVDTAATVGFDIAPDANIAFASLRVGTQSLLYRIDLSTGDALAVNAGVGSNEIGSGLDIRDIAIAPSVKLIALTANNNLVRLDSDAPGTILSTVPISGLQAGENVVGIDFRPATGQLFALGSTSRIYTLDPQTGAATMVGTTPFSPTLNGTEFGIDFNPTVDRIRVTSDLDQNLRLNPISGTVAAIDGTLAYTTTDINAGQNPNVTGVAYTNNVVGVTTTVLYGIDSNLNTLVIQNPPNNGTLNTVGGLGVDVSEVIGFDIQPRTDRGFATLVVSGTTASNLYVMNLGSGKANLIGTIGGPDAIRDIAVLPQQLRYFLPFVARDSTSTP